MPTYRYRAVYGSGRKASGYLAAGTESELAAYLGQAGLELIEARLEKGSHGQNNNWPFRLTSQSIVPRALAQFTSHMHDLLDAGLTFSDAISDIIRNTDERVFKETLEQINHDIQNGAAISRSFARHKKVFPAIFLSILESGEASGNLVRTFLLLKDFCDARAHMHENMRRALRYPIFLIFIAFSVVTFMMIMVVPQVVQFLKSIEGQLPFSTRMLMMTSSYFIDYGWLALIITFVFISLAVALHRHSQKFALWFDRLILRIPAFGAMLHKLALARFAHSFGLLYHSGSTVPESLIKARNTLGNRYLETELDHAVYRLQNGQSLSVALGDMLPSFAARMLRIGEQSGQLAKSLTDIAQICDRQATEVTQQFIGSLEPALTMMIGGVLGWVVLAVFGPVYSNLTRLIGGN